MFTMFLPPFSTQSFNSHSVLTIDGKFDVSLTFATYLQQDALLNSFFGFCFEVAIVYWIFLSIVTYLIVSSYVLMWLRKYDLNLEHPIVQILARINRQLGRPEAIFSSFFLWGAIRQYKLDSIEFNALLWYWVVFMLLNVPSIANTIDSAFDSRVSKDAVNSVGKIFGVQSKNTFLVKLSADRKQALKLFDFVEFQYSIDNREHIGIIVIAQRTANVSKTVLTQCNSVIVFQELDRTTSDFLANYMGKSFVEILPTLKNRTAIAMGKAFRSTAPMIFEVPTIIEKAIGTIAGENYSDANTK